MFDLTRVSLYKIRAFTLTFLAYATYTATRVALPISMSSLHSNDDTFKGYAPFNSKEHGAMYLGILDTVFLVAYSIGLFVSGALGDRIDLRQFMTCGMLHNL
jgi:sugar phosphate permease